MQRLEVAAARARRGTRRRPRADAPDRRPAPRPRPARGARAARELPRRGRRATDDRRDLVERHREHVVQHEREPLGRRQRLEHDQQREADRVGEHRLAARDRRPPPGRDRFWQPRVQRLLAPRLARAQHVQADARDHRRQPAAQVVDTARVGAAEPQPRFLHRVVGLARASRACGRPRPRRWARFASNCSASQIVFVHRSHSLRL